VTFFVRVALAAAMVLGCGGSSDAEERCRTFVSEQSNGDIVYTAEWQDGSARLAWEEDPDGDWWTGHSEYANAVAFVDEGESLGLWTSRGKVIRAEVGGIIHTDTHGYDSGGLLTRIERETQDIVMSDETTTFDQHDQLGRPTHGTFGFVEDDFYSCLDAEVDIHYDDSALTVTTIRGAGLDAEAGPCGRERATRETFNDQLLMVRRERWFDTTDVEETPWSNRSFAISATDEVCVPES